MIAHFAPLNRSRMFPISVRENFSTLGEESDGLGDAGTILANEAAWSAPGSYTMSPAFLAQQAKMIQQECNWNPNSPECVVGQVTGDIVSGYNPAGDTLLNLGNWCEQNQQNNAIWGTPLDSNCIGSQIKSDFTNFAKILATSNAPSIPIVTPPAPNTSNVPVTPDNVALKMTSSVPVLPASPNSAPITIITKPKSPTVANTNPTSNNFINSFISQILPTPDPQLILPTTVNKTTQSNIDNSGNQNSVNNDSLPVPTVANNYNGNGVVDPAGIPFLGITFPSTGIFSSIENFFASLTPTELVLGGIGGIALFYFMSQGHSRR